MYKHTNNSAQSNTLSEKISSRAAMRSWLCLEVDEQLFKRREEFWNEIGWSYRFQSEADEWVNNYAAIERAAL